MLDIGTLKLSVEVDDTQVEELEDNLKEVGESASQAAGKSSLEWNAVADTCDKVSSSAINMGKELVGAASEQETAMVRANAVWGEYADKVLEAANNTEDYMSTEQYLAAVNDIGTKAIAKGVDQVTAFDIAQREMAAGQQLSIATGKDQESIMDGLSMAFMGITGNLGNYTGGLYDNAAGLEQWATDAGIAEESIKSGTYSAEEQAQMMEYLAEKLGGVGDSAETTAQKQAKLESNLTDMKATLGTQLLPIIQSLLDIVTPIVNFLTSIPEPIQKVILVLAGLVTAVTVVVSTIAKVSAVVSSVSTVVTTIIPVIKSFWAVLTANPIGLIITAIAAVIAIFVTLWNKCEAFREFWKKLWEGIKEALQAAWKIIEPIIRTIYNAISAVVDGVKSFLEFISFGLIDFGGSDGSHRTGLSYVPRDGYTATLHRGERVLTRAENEAYSSGRRSNGSAGNNVVYNYNIEVPNNPNAYDTAVTLRDMTRREAYSYAK